MLNACFHMAKPDKGAYIHQALRDQVSTVVGILNKWDIHIDRSIIPQSAIEVLDAIHTKFATAPQHKGAEYSQGYLPAEFRAPLMDALVAMYGHVPAVLPVVLPDFVDPMVQTVYNIMCNETAPPPGQHWEGWQARNIVAALREVNPNAIGNAPTIEPVEPATQPDAMHDLLVSLCKQCGIPHDGDIHTLRRRVELRIDDLNAAINTFEMRDERRKTQQAVQQAVNNDPTLRRLTDAATHAQLLTRLAGESLIAGAGSDAIRAKVDCAYQILDEALTAIEDTKPDVAADVFTFGKAWRAVCDALDVAEPGWAHRRTPEGHPENPTPMAAAVAAINRLATHPNAVTFDFIHRHTGERASSVLTVDEIARYMLEPIYDRLMEQFCHCQPVGETDVVDCNCDTYVNCFHLENPRLEND